MKVLESGVFPLRTVNPVNPGGGKVVESVRARNIVKADKEDKEDKLGGEGKDNEENENENENKNRTPEEEIMHVHKVYDAIAEQCE